MFIWLHSYMFYCKEEYCYLWQWMNIFIMYVSFSIFNADLSLSTKVAWPLSCKSVFLLNGNEKISTLILSIIYISSRYYIFKDRDEELYLIQEPAIIIWAGWKQEARLHKRKPFFGRASHTSFVQTEEFFRIHLLLEGRKRVITPSFLQNGRSVPYFLQSK